jgi:hypothetical protein
LGYGLATLGYGRICLSHAYELIFEG